MRQRVHIGIDYGSRTDYTAITLAKPVREISGAYRKVVNLLGSYRMGSLEGEPHMHTVYHVEDMHRFPLLTRGPVIASFVSEAVIKTIKTTPYIDIRIVMDVTGSGDPIFYQIKDALAYAGINSGELAELAYVEFIPATFTHGDKLYWNDYGRLSVGKAYLVSHLQSLVENGRLKLPKGHKLAKAMHGELMDYEIKVDENANDKYGAFKVGSHDDLVTALGLAVMEGDALPDQLALYEQVRETTTALKELKPFQSEESRSREAQRVQHTRSEQDEWHEAFLMNLPGARRRPIRG